MAQVFISHVTEEQHLASAVERCLTEVFQPNPPTIFLSSNMYTLVGGEQFEGRILKEIRECKAFIVMCSDRSFAKSWVHVESGAAWALKKNVIPVCYGGKTVGELPRPYSNFHAVNLEKPYHLVLAVTRHLGGKGALPPPPPGIHISGDKGERGVGETGPYGALLEELRRAYRLVPGPIRPLAPPSTPSAAENSPFRRAQALLFEIVGTARDYAPRNDDFQKLTNQFWLVGQIREFVSRYFGFKQYSDFENMLDVLRAKAEQIGEGGDSKSMLLAIADHFERVIPALTAEDLDNDRTPELPKSFQDFLKEP